VDMDYYSHAEKRVGLILDATNFYAEQGGQVFDTGKISNLEGDFTVTDVQVYGGYIVHYGVLNSGILKVDATVDMKVDAERRALIASNHTTTHMCNFALRKVLGEHVNQQGSLVLPEKFRFDFSHNSPLKSDELKSIDFTVCEVVQSELPVYCKEVPLEIATKINGVRQMFDEKYPNPVRVVSIGKSVDDLIADPSNPEWNNYSIEFCGGTHITNTKAALSFTVIKEDPLAKGVRRLECITGGDAQLANQRADEFEKEMMTTFANLTTPASITQEVGKQLTQLNELVIPYWRKISFREYLDNQRGVAKKLSLEREANLKKLGQSISTQISTQLTESPKPFLIFQLEEGFSANLIKGVLTAISKAAPSTALLFISFDSDSNRYSAVTFLAKPSLDKGGKANDWLSKALAPINGKSGGKPDSAQGTFEATAEQLASILAAAEEYAAATFN